MKFLVLIPLLIVGETKVCPPGEVFQQCGTACEPTCENTEPSMCTYQCIPNVCQCASGFVRHEGKCILPAFCPKVCKENEELRACGSACEPSCKNPDPVVCTLQCLINVCQCKNGFVRNQEGNCINRDDCPATTPQP